ncbi:MAG: GntR family transcriptional regulator [Sphingomonadaceae bacterium]|nr:GntR family transcriptional regulator [Sphingomonadaceae bacterium]
MAREVIESEAPVGTYLGALPEVAQRFRISVPTLRKAIVYLLDDGVVAMREGRGGGLFVAAPPIESAMRAMHLYLSDRNLSAEQVAEARKAVDGALIERALRFVDGSDHDVLRALIAPPENETALAATAEALEDAVLAAARQPILALFSRLMRRLGNDDAMGAEHDFHTEWRLRCDAAEAILAGNLADALSSWDARRSLADSPGVDPDRVERLADRIAVAIKTFIGAERLAPGDELGHEAGLQERFAVSRNTLRDAIRILERSGAVRVAQGRGGGIFVGAAEPYAAIEMTSLYLSTIRLDFAEQIEARRVLEACAAQLGAARIAPDLATELQAAVAADVAAARIPTADWANKGARVERLVAQACQNPLVEFFTLVMIELSMSEAGRSKTILPQADLARLVSVNHAEIVDAIITRRPIDAAFRTRQYLTHLARWHATSLSATHDDRRERNAP